MSTQDELERVRQAIREVDENLSSSNLGREEREALGRLLVQLKGEATDLILQNLHDLTSQCSRVPYYSPDPQLLLFPEEVSEIPGPVPQTPNRNLEATPRRGTDSEKIVGKAQ